MVRLLIRMVWGGKSGRRAVAKRSLAGASGRRSAVHGAIRTRDGRVIYG
jgi:hypothetical protein